MFDGLEIAELLGVVDSIELLRDTSLVALTASLLVAVDPTELDVLDGVTNAST